MSKWEVKGLATVDVTGKPTFKTEQERKQFYAEIKLQARDALVRIIVTPYDPVQEEEDQRTLKQNRYYHALLEIICDYTGDTHMDMHRRLKLEILGIPFIFRDRDLIEIPSTTGLSTKKFGEYLEKVFKFASEEFGLVLPNPSTI